MKVLKTEFGLIAIPRVIEGKILFVDLNDNKHEEVVVAEYTDELGKLSQRFDKTINVLAIKIGKEIALKTNNHPCVHDAVKIIVLPYLKSIQDLEIGSVVKGFMEGSSMKYMTVRKITVPIIEKIEPIVSEHIKRIAPVIIEESAKKIKITKKKK